MAGLRRQAIQDRFNRFTNGITSARIQGNLGASWLGGHIPISVPHCFNRLHEAVTQRRP